MRPIVYISGPVTKGERVHNVAQGFYAQAKLMLAGFAPINPIASATYPFAWEPAFTHELWMAVDLALVEVSHAVLRLPGESVGADLEVAHAEKLGIPVFTSIEDLNRANRRRAFKVAAERSRRRNPLTDPPPQG